MTVNGVRPQEPLPDLILGVIDNYDFHDLEPFFHTLSATGFGGAVGMFAGPGISRRTETKLRRLGVEIVRFEPAFPFVSDPHPESPKSLPDPIHIFNYRHFLYYDFLLKRGAGYRNVLLTDVRDVIFQAEPFGFGVGNAIHVAIENRGIPIGRSYWTRMWLELGYDESVLERLRHQEVSCAGTVIAPLPLMKRYLQLILAEVATMKDAFGCADQAAHNRLLHDGLLEPSERCYNFAGPILTLGTEPGYRLDSDQRLVNDDGSIIAIVHQYDRHPELIGVVSRLIRPNPLRRTISGIIMRWDRRIGRRLLKLGNFVERTIRGPGRSD